MKTLVSITSIMHRVGSREAVRGPMEQKQRGCRMRETGEAVEVQIGRPLPGTTTTLQSSASEAKKEMQARLQKALIFILIPNVPRLNNSVRHCPQHFQVGTTTAVQATYHHNCNVERWDGAIGVSYATSSAYYL